MRSNQLEAINLEEESTLVIISRKHGTFKIRVDTEDVPRIGRYKWSAHKIKGSIYFHARVRNYPGKRTTLYLHRYLMNSPEGMQVDHVRHDYLDMRKSEMRICTPTQNKQNQPKRKGATSSRFKGVRFFKPRGKWYSFIGIEGKQTYIGSFAHEADAGQAYILRAYLQFGEYASLGLCPLTQAR